MTILVCLDTASGVLTRYDASQPEGLTHAAKLIQNDDEPCARLVQDFLMFPDPALAVKPGVRLIPVSEGVA